VAALWQHAHRLPVLELGEADGPLVRLGPGAAVRDGVGDGGEGAQHLLLDAPVRARRG
jgi:hypothetical protein